MLRWGIFLTSPRSTSPRMGAASSSLGPRSAAEVRISRELIYEFHNAHLARPGVLRFSACRTGADTRTEAGLTAHRHQAGSPAARCESGRPAVALHALARPDGGGPHRRSVRGLLSVRLRRMGRAQSDTTGPGRLVRLREDAGREPHAASCAARTGREWRRLPHAEPA